MTEYWVNVKDITPAPGKYWVKFLRDGKELEGCKVFRTDGKNSKWFGGCRPFCENDVVTHYQVEVKT